MAKKIFKGAGKALKAVGIGMAAKSIIGSLTKKKKEAPAATAAPLNPMLSMGQNLDEKNRKTMRERQLAGGLPSTSRPGTILSDTLGG